MTHIIHLDTYLKPLALILVMRLPQPATKPHLHTCVWTSESAHEFTATLTTFAYTLEVHIQNHSAPTLQAAVHSALSIMVQMWLTEQKPT